MTYIPKDKGVEAEKYVNKFFRGVTNGKGCYDIETKNCLIEVKSCNIINNCNPKHKRPQFGRYSIDTQNHIKLFLEAIRKNKVPIYVFVLSINKRKIFIKKRWDELIIDGLKSYANIPWTHIFYNTYNPKQ